MFDPLDFEFDNDFEATYNPTLPWSTTSSPASVPAQLPDADQHAFASTLEREICTNFTCCGLVIPDMHDLLDHFEERHVLVPHEARSPKPFTLLDSNASSRRSPPRVLSFPRPLTPPSHRLRTLAQSPSSPSETDTPLPSPLEVPLSDFPSSPYALPPASFSTPSLDRQPSSTRRDRGVRGQLKPRPPPTPVVAATTGGTRSASDLTSLRRRDRERERQFRCPKPGCVKSYLNPNGLKYHLDKGTCKMTEEDSPS